VWRKDSENAKALSARRRANTPVQTWKHGRGEAVRRSTMAEAMVATSDAMAVSSVGSAKNKKLEDGGGGGGGWGGGARTEVAAVLGVMGPAVAHLGSRWGCQKGRRWWPCTLAANNKSPQETKTVNTIPRRSDQIPIVTTRRIARDGCAPPVSVRSTCGGHWDPSPRHAAAPAHTNRRARIVGCVSRTRAPQCGRHPVPHAPSQSLPHSRSHAARAVSRCSHPHPPHHPTTSSSLGCPPRVLLPTAAFGHTLPLPVVTRCFSMSPSTLTRGMYPRTSPLVRTHPPVRAPAHPLRRVPARPSM